MIYRSLNDVPADFGPCAITIGNFDGVHRGHQQILERVVALARKYNCKSAVLTFDPHPTHVVAPDRAPRLLSTPEERAHIMESRGIEEVLILPFRLEIARLTPEEFVGKILAKMKPRVVLVGDNFHFGRKASGNAQVLEELGKTHGFDVEIQSDVRWRHRMISSSEIRRLIQSGDVSRACRMLGRPYALEGKVVHGEGVGSKQTVPTLNLDTEAEVLPRTGVYVTRTQDRGASREWPSITNVGYRPTFEGRKLTIETYLLSPLTGSTPQQIAVEFLRWVREEKKFPDPAALKAQILRDVSRAQSYFRRTQGLAASGAGPRPARISGSTALLQP